MYQYYFIKISHIQSQNIMMNFKWPSWAKKIHTREALLPWLQNIFIEFKQHIRLNAYYKIILIFVHMHFNLYKQFFFFTTYEHNTHKQCRQSFKKHVSSPKYIYIYKNKKIKKIRRIKRLTITLICKPSIRSSSSFIPTTKIQTLV